MALVRGVVDAVRSERAGVSLVEDAPAGASSLTVSSAVDLSTDGGVLSAVADDDTPFTVAYSGWVESVTVDGDAVVVVSLAEGLAYPLGVASFLSCAPERVSVVAVVTADGYSDAVSATVPYTMRAVLPEGIRADRDTAEQVLIEWRGSECVVADVVDKRPVIDGTVVQMGDIHLGDMLAESEAELQAAAARITAAEGNIASQVSRVSAVEGAVASQGVRLTTAEGSVASIASRTTTVEGRVTATESSVATANASITQKIAMGSDLVRNGTGVTKTAANFTGSTVSLTDTPPGAVGSFVYPAGSRTVMVDDLIPYDPGKAYRLSFSLRQLGASTTGRAYGFLAPYDAAGQAISPGHYMFVAGTTTTLAAPVKDGDTVVKITDPAGWFGAVGKPASTSTHFRSMIVWAYTDPNGKAWAPETYSRIWTQADRWADGGIAADGTITLKTPWNLGSFPAGTPVSNGSAGQAYMYTPACANVVVPSTWASYADTYGAKGGAYLTQPKTAGAGGTVASWDTPMPPGTAQVKIGWLLNYPSPGTDSRMAVANVSMSDASAAALAIANGKSTTVYAASAPTVASYKSGDTWFKTDGSGNVLGIYRHTGSTWAAAPVDGSSLVADSVTTAQIAAGAVTAAELAAGSVTAGKVAAGAVQAGALQAGAVTAGSIEAGAVTTDSLAAGAVAAGKIAAGAVTAETLAARLVLGSQIVAGDPSSGTYAQMDGTGITLHGPGPEGTTLTTGSLGVVGADDYLQLYDSDGMPAASIDSDGSITGRAVETDRLSIGGTDFNEIMTAYPRGVMAWGRVPSTWAIGKAFSPVMSAAVTVPPGRLIRATVPPCWVNFTAAGTVYMFLRYRVGNGTDIMMTSGNISQSPATTSVLFPGLSYYLPFSATTPTDIQVTAYASASADNVAKFLAGGQYAFGLAVEDVGPYIPDNLTYYAAPTAAAQDATTSAPAKTTYTTTWRATGTGSYRGDGSKRTDTTDMVQGQYSANGNQYSMSVFGGGAVASSSSGEVGKTISAALSGATVSKVEAWVYFSHWYGQTGTARLLAGSASTVPATSAPPTGPVVESAGWPRGAGRWVTIGASAATRSVWLAQPTTAASTTYYGRAGGAGGAQAYAPQLRITYSR